MNYATISFLCFLLMTGIVYFIVPKKLQWLVLLIASLLFYILSCGIMAMFLPAAAAVVYAAGLLLSREDDRLTLRLKEAADMTAMTAAGNGDDVPIRSDNKAAKKALKKQTERKKKKIVAVSVALLILMILSTKYCNFFGSAANSAVGLLGFGKLLPTFHIIMPLGISYYTLMGISYITDVYRKSIPAERNPLEVAAVPLLLSPYHRRSIRTIWTVGPSAERSSFNQLRQDKKRRHKTVVGDIQKTGDSRQSRAHREHHIFPPQ